ncbi:MAG: class I SAM-dependent methyltransferase [Sphaerobacteraceae bacterium]|nr:MAG: class I SAM-dependent methyltransferase [Sphaerobacteraceae bacterium]
MATEKRDPILENVYSAKSNDELEQAYDAWADRYDEDVFQRGYMLPAITAGYVGRHVPANAKIVDAGAGTGIIGRVLNGMGHDNITGFDLSNGMLKIARDTGVYTELDRQVIGEPLKYESNSFDACVSVGTFTEGHAPSSGFDEIARIVKPGGHFIVTIRPDIYENEGYQDKVAEMTKAGTMKLVEKSEKFRLFTEVDPHVQHCVFVYQVQ